MSLPIKNLCLLTIFTAFFSLSCMNSSSKLQIPETNDSNNQKTGPLKTNIKPKLDILFVVDDSQSMELHQQNLEQNINNLMDNIWNSNIIDYHIGVVTTDMVAPNRRGKLIGWPIYIQDKRDLPALRIKLKPGTKGDGNEYVFAPVRNALTTHRYGYNSGFYRDDAFLALIVITDSEDHSFGQAEDFYNFLVKLKNGQRDKVLVYGVLADKRPIFSRCKRDDPDLNFLRKMIKISGGFSFSLCDKEYGKKLTQVALEIRTRVTRVIYLKERPVLSTLKVLIGGKILENDNQWGWTYDPELNLIRLGKKLVESNKLLGAKLEIIYDAADL